MARKRLTPLHPAAQVFAWGSALLGGVSALGFFVDKTQKATSQAWIVKADSPGVKLASGTYEIHYWFLFATWLFLCLTILLFSVDVLVLQRLLASRRKSQAQLSEEYTRVCDSIRNVVYQIYNPENPTQEPRPRINFIKIFCEFEINASGDTKVTQTYTVITKDLPAHFWTVKMLADQYAAPCVTLDDISFRAESHTEGCSLETLPLDNRGIERSVALFFLPEIGAEQTREYSVSYDWQGWFGELFSEHKATNWTWLYQSHDADDTAEVTFKFVFQKECGQIFCVNSKPKLPGETLDVSVSGTSTVWEYRNPSAPVGRLNWDLKFSHNG